MTSTTSQSPTTAISGLIHDTQPRRKIHWGRVVLAIFVLAVFAALGWCILENHCSPTGEPFSWNEGISIWPSEIVCAFAAMLSALFFVKARLDLLANKQELRDKFSLRPAFERGDVKKEWRQHLERFEQRLKRQVPWHRWLFIRLKWISIHKWECPSEASGANCSDRNAAAARFSTHYNVLGFWPHRICRCLPSIVAYTMLASGVWLLGETPFVPYRGDLSGTVDNIVFWASVVFQTALIFFTVDASYLCRKFIDNLAGMDILPWSDETEATFEKRCGLRVAFTEEYIAAEVIGERSAAVGRLIFYPFFVLFLTIVSRASFFDHWNWPLSLILIFGVNAAVAAYSVWATRRAAENARKVLLDRLHGKIRRNMGGKTPGLVEKLQNLAKEIESNEKGAFAPITKQPLIHAALMPIGAAGLSTVLNYLPKL
jgi:hypothetical protein